MKRRDANWVVCLLALGVLALPPATDAGESGGRKRARKTQNRADFHANRLLKQAMDYINAKQTERGVKMLQSIAEQFPDSFVKYKAYLELGRHYINTHQEKNALWPLKQLLALKKPDEELKDEALDIYLEGLYLTGVSYYNSRQYTSAFPVLRRITKSYPNTVWANQSYYYIGMGHFRMENWKKAIDALSLVGTFVDTQDESVKYIEAGSRFYVKIEDTDLPVLRRLGRPIKAEVRSANGDSEEITCVPLNRTGDIYIGSIVTRVGPIKPELIGDGLLQVLGGDEITTRYLDDNTFSGDHNIERSTRTVVISTGQIAFTLGTWEDQADAAFIGQPVFVKVKDADLDRSAKPETVKVKVISRHWVEVEEEEGAAHVAGIDIEKLLNEEKERDRWVIRDEVELDLTEVGEAPVRTGRFGGKTTLREAAPGEPVNKTDDVLTCQVGDEIVAVYVDALHILGRSERSLMVRLPVVGEFDSRPVVTTSVVNNPVVRTRKNLVEAEAFLELGRIFRDMGLTKKSGEKCEEGLEKLDAVLRLEGPVPRNLLEKTYQLKWKTQMIQGNLVAAMDTCTVFNRQYPESPLVDEALKEIGMIHLEKGNFEMATTVFEKVLALTNSQIKAEAQFRLAECTEKAALAGGTGRRSATADPKLAALSAAVPAYQTCAEKYPESEFAGPSLAKLIDYHLLTKDYVTCKRLLENVFREHPDAPYLDQMLLKWTLVACRMGNYRQAQEKCAQLLFEHPESRFAPKAQKLLPAIEKRLKKSVAGDGEAKEEGDGA